MKKPEEIIEILKNKFSTLEFALDVDTPVEPVIMAPAKEINKISLFLRDEAGLEFDSLMCLSGVDDANGEKIKLEDGSEEIRGGTLSVFYHLYSIVQGHKITLKVSTGRDNPEVESVESVWKTANWHEREAYDMVGIVFLNHPDLTRILMPEDWEAGFPLRKDYRDPEFYHGIKVPY